MLTALLSLLTFSPVAQAGGIGTISTAGVRGQEVYFYDESADFQKYSIGQTIANFGTGLEVLLGDRDDRIQGHFRGYWLMETPEQNPAQQTSLVAPQDVTAAWREDPRHIGMATVGLQFGIIGDPDTFQFVATGDIGSGFLTLDHTEFLLVEVGAGITQSVGRDTQIFAGAVYALRQDRGLQHGSNIYAGLRYLFD